MGTLPDLTNACDQRANDCTRFDSPQELVNANL